MDDIKDNFLYNKQTNYDLVHSNNNLYKSMTGTKVIENKLHNKFLSSDNVEYIRDYMHEYINNKYNNEFSIKKITHNTLLEKMHNLLRLYNDAFLNEIYSIKDLKNIKITDQLITNNLNKLNQILLNELIPLLESTIKEHIRYIRDISRNPLTPVFGPPQNTRCIKNNNILHTEDRFF